MFRASSPRASPQVVNPANNDAYDAYDSYAVSENPNVPDDVAPKIGDGNAHRGSLSGGLDVQPLPDRINALPGETVSLKRDMGRERQPY